jgi:hypothetical protein
VKQKSDESLKPFKSYKSSGTIKFWNAGMMKKRKAGDREVREEVDSKPSGVSTARSLQSVRVVELPEPQRASVLAGVGSSTTVNT